jgi:solute:Na+ symporter, SSS family
MLSYFGTDQSQVQRYLAAKSIDEARSSLLMSAYWKIPLQALVLLVGVLIFLFYTFSRAPLLWNPAHDRRCAPPPPAEFAAFDARYEWRLPRGSRSPTRPVPRVAIDRPRSSRFRKAMRRGHRASAPRRSRARGSIGQPTRDVNYIIPRFVLDHLPLGLAGLFLAAVLAAAMSSIAAELNALATASVVDFYQVGQARASDYHYLRVGKVATACSGAPSPAWWPPMRRPSAR